ncbi:MAG TPA: hypothetical protein VGQ42_04085 [Candidatus Dormibacteraeota bacterium]|nr:hypothetical protein [Candidatus Dormibacteraeota bacterium]
MSGSDEGGASRRGLRRLTTPGGIFLVAVLLLCALPVTSRIGDPDFWWHLRTGQLILDNHALIQTDPYTYTASTHHWTMHEWLTEVLLAGLNHIGGMALIVVVLSITTWLGLLALLMRALLRRPGFIAAGAGLLLATVSGYPIWGPRAQMITFALTCLLLLIVERHLTRGGRAVWLLVPIFLVWSNLHSGFIIGAAFLGLIVAVESVLRAMGRSEVDPQRLRTLVYVLVACLVVVVINPSGPHIYLYPFETQGSAAQQSLIQEWHSPNFHLVEVRAFEAMLLTLGIMVAITRRVRPRDGVLVLATVAMALQSVRHIALFIAVATPMWIEQADMVGRRVFPSVVTRMENARETVRMARRGGMLLGVVVAVCGSLVLTQLAVAASTRADSLTYARTFPVCAARWLDTAPSGINVFNQYGEGGYLARSIVPHGDRIFIFGDAALMGDDLLRTYGDVESVRPSWERILQASHTDLVLFDNGTPLANVLATSPRWVLVYRDPYSVAYIPAGSPLVGKLPPQTSYAQDSRDTCGLLQNLGLGDGS